MTLLAWFLPLTAGLLLPMAWADQPTQSLPPPSVLEGALEPEYADAIIQFKKGARRDSIRTLEALLAKLGPDAKLRDRKRILELQALAHTYEKEDQKSRALHSRILDLVREQKAPESEGAPSVFEIALIDLKANQVAQARTGFERSLQLGYNSVASRFFLGFIDYRVNDFDSAVRRFKGALAGPAPPELRSLALLYLSRMSASAGDGARSLRYAEEAQEIGQGAAKAAADAQYSQGAQGAGFRERASLDLRFDSNSAFLPLGLNPTDSGFITNDGLSAGSNDLDLWLGYVSTASADWQWSIHSDTRILAHWARSARGADFLDQKLVATFSHTPLDRVSYGLELGLEMLWIGEDIEPYRLQGLISPYFRREIQPELVFRAQMRVRPGKNYFDRRFMDSLARSGPAFDLRVSLFADTMRSFWNPGLSVLMEVNQTSGKEFRSRMLGLELNTLIFPSRSLRGSLGATLGAAGYFERPSGSRYDPFLELEASGTYTIRGPFAARGQVSWLSDFSSVGQPYRFNRFTLLAGVEVQL